MMKIGMKKRCGFTLIEILIVISILSILVAIFAYAAAVASGKSRETACLSNQRQLGQAIAMYASDYDERYPHAAIESYIWAFGIDSYVKNFDVFQCPSADVLHPPKGLAKLPNGQLIPSYITYIYNIHVGGVVNVRSRHPDLEAVNRSMSYVVNPSRTVMLTDGSTTAHARILPSQWQPKAYTPWNVATLADAYYSGVVMPEVSGPSAPRALHGDRAVVLFCDGHLRSMHIQDFYNSPEVVEVSGKQSGYSPCLDPASGCLK